MIHLLIIVTLLSGCLGQGIIQSHQLAIVEQEVLENIRKPIMILMESMLKRKQQEFDKTISEKLSGFQQLEILKAQVERLPTFEQIESIKHQVKNLTLQINGKQPILEQFVHLKEQVDELQTFEQFESLKNQVQQLPTFEQFETFKDQIRNLTLTKSNDEFPTLEQFGSLEEQVESIALISKNGQPTLEQVEALNVRMQNLNVTFSILKTDFKNFVVRQGQLVETLNRTKENTKECLPSWIRRHSKCYSLGSVMKTYDEGQSSCRTLGAHLAFPTDNAENNFIADFFNGRLGWIGVNDLASEGRYLTVTGRSITYNKWNEKEPNDAGTEDCVEINSSGRGGWNDVSCRQQRLYACERSI